jgi:hypothetical protein
MTDPIEPVADSSQQQPTPPDGPEPPPQRPPPEFDTVLNHRVPKNEENR